MEACRKGSLAPHGAPSQLRPILYTQRREPGTQRRELGQHLPPGAKVGSIGSSPPPQSGLLEAVQVAKSSSPWTAQQIPSQAGKTALVTGANSGIGYQAALELARHGAHVLLGCRNAAKGADALKRLLAGGPGCLRGGGGAGYGLAGVHTGVCGERLPLAGCLWTC